ncbi:hypothetical protein AYK26_05035 [Euryarchaeota archaeon SM23-78]|nr:MAG: hypothetical protein AYK26_05035 [Euryarchaeota archaeon SM23-78]
MSHEKSDVPKKIELELWVEDDMSTSIKKSSLELTTEEVKLFYFADDLVQLREEFYKKTKHTIIQLDGETGRLYRTLTYYLF